MTRQPMPKTIRERPPCFGCIDFIIDEIENCEKVDAVEVPCRCCDCYYLLSGKNSFGLYFFCGHQNGLKNLRNTNKDFCPYAKKRMDGDGNG